MKKKIILSCLTLIIVVCLVLSVASILGAGALIWRTRAVGSGSAIPLAVTTPLAKATFPHASKMVYPLGFYPQKGSCE